VGLCELWLGKELVLQLGRVFHKIGIQFLHKLLCFGSIHVGFALGG